MSAWKHHGLFLMAVSRVGGAKRRPPKVDVAWISMALVLNQAGNTRGAHAPPGIAVLDKAFVLIEGRLAFERSYFLITALNDDPAAVRICFTSPAYGPLGSSSRYF